ncbi:hypothetical protein ACHAWX_003679 [Stephanocyclus meneghinianus]
MLQTNRRMTRHRRNPAFSSHGNPSQGNNKSRSVPASLRDQFVRTNADVILMGSLLALYNYAVMGDAADFTTRFLEDSSKELTNYTTLPSTHCQIGSPYMAFLYPWFTQTIAVLIYYILSRYFPSLPYTAIVFLLGMSIGFAASCDATDAILQSAEVWLGINGQLILLIFLPGLIFLDSYTIDVHLFFQAFWQLMTFAFPMVLFGTFLTAIVGKFMFPFNWSWDLSMTFGAILSSTDPISVAGLMKTLGAPPRLQMHISGESLLNDGAAVLFFNIFSSRYFAQMGIEGFGTKVGWLEGFIQFFRLSLGGAAIGMLFGIATVLMLKLLNRRLSSEENVIQVVLMMSSAYLGHFVSEVLCGCSGIIATLTSGITIKVLGDRIINDGLLTLHFWQVTGQLLNTLLFILGGTLWGNVINPRRAAGWTDAEFGPIEWLWLFALFFMLIIIRFVIVFSFYPITMNIGVGTSIKESLFMSYAGFRGAAMATSLITQVFKNTGNDTQYLSYREDVFYLYGMTGGIALLTLLIFGITCRPLICFLKLVTPPQARLKVIENYRRHLKKENLICYVKLLSQERFKDVDYALVRAHVPFLKDLTLEQLLEAVKMYKDATPYYFQPPYLELVLPYLLPEGGNEEAFDMKTLDDHHGRHHRRGSTLLSTEQWNAVFESDTFRDDGYLARNGIDPDDLTEQRLNFIEILRSVYHDQISNGELESRGDVPYSLFRGLDFCKTAVGKGKPLNDWEGTQVACKTWVPVVDEFFHTCLRHMGTGLRTCKTDAIDMNYFKVCLVVRQILPFLRAHRHAQKIFKNEFAGSQLTPAELKVIEESDEQVSLAESVLEKIDKYDVTVIKGHLMCQILLQQSVYNVEKLHQKGLLPDEEANEIIENLNVDLQNVFECEQLDHDGCLASCIVAKRLKELDPVTKIDLNIIEQTN